MRILAIDTSCRAASVAIVESGEIEPLAMLSRAMAKGQAEALPLMADEALRAVPGGLESIERIAVTIGPGSFTGIRVGLAFARAMGLALGVPVADERADRVERGQDLSSPRPRSWPRRLHADRPRPPPGEDDLLQACSVDSASTSAILSRRIFKYRRVPHFVPAT